MKNYVECLKSGKSSAGVYFNQGFIYLYSKTEEGNHRVSYVDGRSIVLDDSTFNKNFKITNKKI